MISPIMHDMYLKISLNHVVVVFMFISSSIENFVLSVLNVFKICPVFHDSPLQFLNFFLFLAM